MTVSKYPSAVTLPEAPVPWPSILDFLCRTFPGVSREQWAERIAEGRVLDERGKPITPETPYAPSRRLHYFRETDSEPVIPFPEHILFQNDEILVACKPHWLPVIPGGQFVNECLLNRLRRRTGIDDLAPMHRLDRETAGVVLFSVNKKTRSLYHGLFSGEKAEKTYHALARISGVPQENEWRVENRIVRGEPRFIMTVTPGTANARSHIRLLEVRGARALFSLKPLTGKTHQLRVHMSGLGFPILNDRYYPVLRTSKDQGKDADLDRPLQLVAKTLRFNDPVTGDDMEFCSRRELVW